MFRNMAKILSMEQLFGSSPSYNPQPTLSSSPFKPRPSTPFKVPPHTELWLNYRHVLKNSPEVKAKLGNDLQEWESIKLKRFRGLGLGFRVRFPGYFKSLGVQALGYTDAKVYRRSHLLLGVLVFGLQVLTFWL